MTTPSRASNEWRERFCGGSLWSPGEIAVVLGKTESSIHGLHHHGRHNLQASLIELEVAPVTEERAPEG